MSQNEVEFVIRVTIDDESIQRLAERVVHLLELPDPAEVARERRLAASKHALFGGKEPSKDAGLLIDTRAVAELLNVSQKTVYKRDRDEAMPKPLRIGRAKRWGAEEIKAWVDEGCPPRSEWKWPKSESKSPDKM